MEGESPTLNRSNHLLKAFININFINENFINVVGLKLFMKLKKTCKRFLQLFS